MLETNIFVLSSYPGAIHIIQRDFEILTLFVYVDHWLECDVTLFCVMGCCSVYSGAFTKHCEIRLKSI